MTSLKDSLISFHAGRNPSISLKYKKMKENPFRYFRGTAYRFYQNSFHERILHSPAAHICGDSHLENFGSYRAENRVVYFDINDFDESCIAPVALEPLRFLTGLILASDSNGLTEEDGLSLCHAYVNTWFDELKNGYTRSLESASARGLIKEFIENLEARKHKDFIKKKTEKTKMGRKIKIDGQKYQTASEDEIDSVIYSFRQKENKLDPDFYRVLDVVLRNAGTASLGLKRYLVLIEGTGGSSGNMLIDLKEANPACIPFAQTHTYSNEAERIIENQKKMQGNPPAMIKSMIIQSKPYVMKELQSSEDKMDLDIWDGKLKRLEKVIQTMAKISSWSHLRSSGRTGSASADQLIEFASDPSWKYTILESAKESALRIQEEHREFVKLYDAGSFHANA